MSWAHLTLALRARARASDVMDPLNTGFDYARASDVMGPLNTGFD